MTRNYYEIAKSEKIIYKVNCESCGYQFAYTDMLIESSQHIDRNQAIHELNEKLNHSREWVINGWNIFKKAQKCPKCSYTQSWMIGKAKINNTWLVTGFAFFVVLMFYLISQNSNPIYIFLPILIGLLNLILYNPNKGFPKISTTNKPKFDFVKYEELPLDLLKNLSKLKVGLSEKELTDLIGYPKSYMIPAQIDKLSPRKSLNQRNDGKSWWVYGSPVGDFKIAVENGFIGNIEAVNSIINRLRQQS